ncbi:MAG TPA: cytochrome P450 [Acidimicrobiia bacterium]|jgi:cytochrome P450
MMDPDDILIELLSDPQTQDPYPLYRSLRETAPNHPSMLGVRFVSSHAGCTELMRSHDFTTGFGLAGGGFEDRPFIKKTMEILVFTNGEQHTRLRRLVGIAFSPRMVEGVVPRLQAFVDGVLDDIAAAGGAELVTEYAMPVPAMALTEMLGAPFEDHRAIQGWVDAVANSMRPVLEDELVRLADIATEEFDRYIRDLIAARRRNPGDDLLSALIAVEEEGDRLTENELANLLFTIMAAGNETTTSLVSTGTMLLLDHPDELKKLVADPGLMGNAVEEILRYEAPIQNAFMRIAACDTTLLGDEVVEGEMVAALVGAANRDPAVFPDPDRFQVDRPGAEAHLSFGAGIHFCLGRRIGLQSGMLALSSLIRRFPDLRLADRPVWRKTVPTRRLDRLDVTLA